MADNCTFKSIKKVFLKDLIRHFIMAMIFLVVFFAIMCLGSLLFFYIEHCYDVTQKSWKPLEENFFKFCRLLGNYQTSVEAYEHYNTEGNSTTVLNDEFLLTNSTISQMMDICTAKKQVNALPRCILDLRTFLKWLDYCTTIGYTIGYGHIVASSNTGKFVTIFYAIPSIGVTMALNIYIGNVFVDGTKMIIVWFESKVLKHKIIRRISLKVFLYQAVMAILSCLVFAASSRQWIFNDEDMSFVDAVYYSFVTLSTIGFGDIHWSLEAVIEKNNWIEIFIGHVIFFVSMGCMASAIAGFGSFLTKEKNIRKRKKQHFIMKLLNKLSSKKRHKVYVIDRTAKT